MRIRTVLGETNWIENGSDGSTAYSPSGKVTPLKGRRTGSMLSKAMRGTNSLRCHRTLPSPFTGSNAARRSAKKYVLLYSWKSLLISTGSLSSPGGWLAEAPYSSGTARNGRSRLMQFMESFSSLFDPRDYHSAAESFGL